MKEGNPFTSVMHIARRVSLRPKKLIKDKWFASDGKMTESGRTCRYSVIIAESTQQNNIIDISCLDTLMPHDRGT
jgi:hypothetical protein